MDSLCLPFPPQAVLDYDALKLKSFYAGALVSNTSFNSIHRLNPTVRSSCISPCAEPCPPLLSLLPDLPWPHIPWVAPTNKHIMLSRPPKRSAGQAAGTGWLTPSATSLTASDPWVGHACVLAWRPPHVGCCDDPDLVHAGLAAPREPACAATCLPLIKGLASNVAAPCLPPETALWLLIPSPGSSSPLITPA